MGKLSMHAAQESGLRICSTVLYRNFCLIMNETHAFMQAAFVLAQMIQGKAAVKPTEAQLQQLRRMLRVAGAVQPANPAPVSMGTGKKRARIEEGGLFLQRVPLQQPLETPAVQLVVPLQQPLEGLAIPPKGPELGEQGSTARAEEAGLFLQRRVPVQKPLETPVIQPVLPLQQPLEVPAVLPMRPKLGQQDSTA